MPERKDILFDRFFFHDRYGDDLTDRKECNCRNDCEMVHFFSTMQRQPYSETSVAQSNSQTWFDVKKGSPSGALGQTPVFFQLSDSQTVNYESI